MTFRIDVESSADSLTVLVQGLIDAQALASIRTALARGRAREVVLVIKEGSDIEPAVVGELRRLARVTVVAESAFLARWLAET